MRWMFGLACGALLSAGCAALAEEEVSELPKVVVTGEEADALGGVNALKLPLRLELMPRQISIVSGQTMREQDNRTLRDAMENVPGVLATTGHGVHDMFVMRGVDSLTGGLVMYDQAPEPEAAFYHMYNVDRVEVIHGPGSFLHGANSMGGAVNLVYKRPGFRRSRELTLQGGSYETYRALLDVETVDADNAFAARVNLLRESSAGFRDGHDHDVAAISPAFTVRLGDSTLGVVVDYQRNEFTPDMGLPVVGDRVAEVSRRRSFQTAGDFSEQDIVRAQLLYETTLGQDVALRNRLYHTDLDWRSRGALPAGFVLFGLGVEPAPTTLSRYVPTLDDQQEIIGNQLELGFQVDLGRPHDVVAGVDVARFSDTFTLAIPPGPDVNIATLAETPGILPPLPTIAADARTEIVGLYVGDHVDLGESLTLFAGARVDHLDFKDDVSGAGRDEDLFNSSVGLTWSVSEDVNAFVAYGTGYAPPSARVVGPRGRPEESLSVEGGVDMSLVDDTVHARVAIYTLERDDIAIVDSRGLTSRSGEQTTDGIELSLAAEPAPGLAVRAAYGYQDAELDAFSEFLGPVFMDHSGNEPAYTPQHIVNLWATYELTEAVGLGLGGRYTSEQFIAPDNRFELDSSFIVDAAIYYETPRWDLALNLNNIADEDAYGRGESGLSVIPVSGRSATATIRHRF